MHQKLCIIITAIIISASASAQTPLPYFTGFDDSTQTAGWQEFHQGVDPGIYGWAYQAIDPYSVPISLYHPGNPMASSTDTIIDWWVSPQFDFSGGAMIDRMYAEIGNFSPLPADFIGLYLLNGSPDPSLATTITLLVDFTSFPNGIGGGWDDTTNIIIPSTPGASYIAFKYIGTNNGLFNVSFDDINISALATGIENVNADAEINVYPNPANKYLSLSKNISANAVVVITGIDGKVLKSFLGEEINSKNLIDISDLSSGIYFLKSYDGKNSTAKIFIKQ